MYDTYSIVPEKHFSDALDEFERVTGIVDYFVAGGAALANALPMASKTYSDVDFYVQESLILKYYERISKAFYASGYSFTAPRWLVHMQIIPIADDTPLTAVLDDFDLTVCRVGYDSNKDEWTYDTTLCGPILFGTPLRGLVNLNALVAIGSRLKTLARIQKYANRYELPTSEIAINLPEDLEIYRNAALKEFLTGSHTNDYPENEVYLRILDKVGRSQKLKRQVRIEF